MRPLYFAHGYRKREASFASYFSKLMGKLGYLPSLDPPSGAVNSAKLERHLRYTEGLVAVLADREEGPSKHILYEISMAVRARKPSLVFIEDTLPESILPNGILKCRFTASSNPANSNIYVREIRNHLHALEMLKSYLGDEQLPRYQVSTRQRTCLLTGTNGLSNELRDEIIRLLGKRGYNTVDMLTLADSIPLSGEKHYNIGDADLSISIVSSDSIISAYGLAVVQSMLVPTILLSTKDYPLKTEIPESYQPQLINNKETSSSLSIIEKHIDLFEQDFINIDNEDKADEYANQLMEVSLPPGQYTQHIRTQIIKEVTVGDKYEAKQGILGRNVHAHDITFNQIWNQAKETVDLQKLLTELITLREELQKSAKTAEDFSAIGAIADAEIEAKKGNGPKTLAALAKAGKWALGVAEKIGVDIATAAIKSSYGVGS
jgi:hypothetical protein